MSISIDSSVDRIVISSIEQVDLKIKNEDKKSIGKRELFVDVELPDCVNVHDSSFKKVGNNEWRYLNKIKPSEEVNLELSFEIKPDEKCISKYGEEEITINIKTEDSKRVDEVKFDVIY